MSGVGEVKRLIGGIVSRTAWYFHNLPAAYNNV